VIVEKTLAVGINWEGRLVEAKECIQKWETEFGETYTNLRLSQDEYESNNLTLLGTREETSAELTVRMKREASRELAAQAAEMQQYLMLKKKYEKA